MESRKINEFVGQSFEDLSVEEMEKLQGNGDIQVESSPVAWSLIGVSVLLCFPKSAS